MGSDHGRVRGFLHSPSAEAPTQAAPSPEGSRVAGEAPTRDVVSAGARRLPDPVGARERQSQHRAGPALGQIWGKPWPVALLRGWPLTACVCV